MAISITTHVCIQVPLCIVELLLHIQACMLNILLELHLLVAVGTSSVCALNILRPVHLGLGRFTAALLLLLHFDHLLLSALQLLQEC